MSWMHGQDKKSKFLVEKKIASADHNNWIGSGAVVVFQ